MSLRGRLIALLVAVAALGLFVLAGVTYAEQRSFQLQRVEEQGVAVLPGVVHRLDPTDAARDGADRRGGPGRPPEARLVSGVYGQLRDASGKVLRSGALLGFGQTAPPPPKWPATAPTGHWITVGSTSNSGVRYRVRAFPRPHSSGTALVAVPLIEVDRTLHRLLAVDGLVIGGVILVLALIAWWLVRLGLRPLDRMGATADAIAAGDLTRRVSPADARTEVGRLGLALNGMLAQIERAFSDRQASETRLRRFLADASHELRTPVTSIRGYAELFRIGAVRDPDETAKAMARIEQESARMGALIEDLLTLARLDQLPEPSRDPVDLSELLADAGDDARASAPGRSISVEADGSTIVEGDASRLRQVIANLTRNALVHTPEGTPIELRATGTDGHVTLEVRDHGPGLPSNDGAALFERFWRADPGRGRGPAGAGLGLSIVAALVAVHRGTVRAENAEGGGARFLVTLPAHARDAAPAALPSEPPA